MIDAMQNNRVGKLFISVPFNLHRIHVRPLVAYLFVYIGIFLPFLNGPVLIIVSYKARSSIMRYIQQSFDRSYGFVAIRNASLFT